METAAETRARYSNQGSCTVDGVTVSPGQLSVRTMNFGQHWRTPGVLEVEYSAVMPRRFLADFLRSQLPEFIDDAITHPDLDHQLENELRRRGWPDAEEILSHASTASLAISYYACDLVIEWFGQGVPHDSPGFVINTVAETAMSSFGLTIQGTARRDDRSVVYQDI